VFAAREPVECQHAVGEQPVYEPAGHPDHCGGLCQALCPADILSARAGLAVCARRSRGAARLGYVRAMG
jgi:hypothetical protein